MLHNRQHYKCFTNVTLAQQHFHCNRNRDWLFSMSNCKYCGKIIKFSHIPGILFMRLIMFNELFDLMTLSCGDCGWVYCDIFEIQVWSWEVSFFGPFFIHILKSWSRAQKTHLKLSLLAEFRLFQLKLGFFGSQLSLFGPNKVSSQKPWFYSLNITTFCDTWCFKYEHMFSFIKNYVYDFAWSQSTQVSWT